MKNYKIYSLTRFGNVFYIGVTTNIDTRYRNHQRRYGHGISIQVLQDFNGTEQEAYSLEGDWIRKYRDLGVALVNIINYKKTKVLKTYKITDEDYFAAMQKADSEGVTLSELIEGFILAYAEGKDSFVLFKKSGIKEYFID